MCHHTFPAYPCTMCHHTFPAYPCTMCHHTFPAYPCTMCHHTFPAYPCTICYHTFPYPCTICYHTFPYPCTTDMPSHCDVSIPHAITIQTFPCDTLTIPTHGYHSICDLSAISSTFGASVFLEPSGDKVYHVIGPSGGGVDRAAGRQCRRQLGLCAGAVRRRVVFGVVRAPLFLAAGPAVK